MYCPICGAESTQGLNYCKRCGTGLTPSVPPIPDKTSVGKAMGLMLFLVSVVSIAGFVALFSTVYNLGERQYFDTRALVAIMAFGGATVIGVIGLLVWLLLRFTTGPQPVAHHDKTAKPGAREYNAPQLAAPPIGLTSVTENTTRNFEPGRFREKDSRE